jgi:3-oxoacyl-[acyl-carrier protein] reductase
VQRLNDQVAIVTGGAQGVGRGIASVLAAEGAHVVIADVDESHADSTVAALREQGFEARAVTTDVTDRASIEAMTGRIVAEQGQIDILAANAGIYPTASIEALDDALWDRVMEINVKGAVRVVQACLPTMTSRRYGRIVLTSSITGPVTGHSGFALYGASKAAMLGFMRSAAVELAMSGVTINAVLPGNVQTPGFADTTEEHQRQMLGSIPMQRYADPEEVGWAVRFLASKEAGYITGQTLIVDGGQTLPEGSSDPPSSTP